MIDIQRYDIFQEEFKNFSLEECANGDLVKYEDHVAKIKELEIQLEQAKKDQERLDFVLCNSAFTVKEMPVDARDRWQLMNQDEDEYFHVLSGEGRSFTTEREAIDAAIASIKEQGK